MKQYNFLNIKYNFILREKGWYGTTEDLLRLVESKFSGTTVCIGNTDLREESFVIEGGKNLTFSSLLLSFVSMFNILYFNMSHVKINRPFSMVVSPTCLGYYKPEPDEVVEGGRGRCPQCALK